MSEISANLKNIFSSQKPPILKLEFGFFSDRKRFSQIFENRQFFLHLNFFSIKKKSEKLFSLVRREGGSSLPKVGSPNPGKAGSGTAAEHRFVNQKLQNIKKMPITNAEFEPKNQ